MVQISNRPTIILHFSRALTENGATFYLFHGMQLEGLPKVFF